MIFGQPKANLRYCAKCGKVCFDLHGPITLERYIKIYLLSLRGICKLFVKFSQSKLELSSDMTCVVLLRTRSKNLSNCKNKIVKIEKHRTFITPKDLLKRYEDWTKQTRCYRPRYDNIFIYLSFCLQISITE
jgi:hypothetical protein